MAMQSLKKKDIYYRIDVLDEMIKICTYMKDDSVREVRTWNSEIQNFFKALNYEVEDNNITRKQEDVLDLGCYM